MESRGQNALRSRRTGGWVYHNIMILIGRYLLFTHIHKAYLFFWDKLNKCNYYLELSIQHADLPVDDRLVSHLSDDLISDGGQWDMVVNLLEVSFSFLTTCQFPSSDPGGQVKLILGLV